LRSFIGKRRNGDGYALEGLGEADRLRALKRFQILRPFLEEEVRLAKIARQEDIPVRTAWEWVNQYRKHGVAGLARKPRSDKYKRQISTPLQHAIEGLALRKPRLAVAAIHREAANIAQKLGEHSPSYDVVHSIIREIEPGLLALAHEGAKTCSNTSICSIAPRRKRRAIWQVDHTQLDILIEDRGQPRKPWLTIILDDYSRAVAGYAVSLSAPSAMQTRACAEAGGKWVRSELRLTCPPG
jgi:putative transposase